MSPSEVQALVDALSQAVGVAFVTGVSMGLIFRLFR